MKYQQVTYLKFKTSACEMVNPLKASCFEIPVKDTRIDFLSSRKWEISVDVLKHDEESPSRWVILQMK